MVTFQPVQVLPDAVWQGWLLDVRNLLIVDSEWPEETIFACASVELGLTLGRDVYNYYYGKQYANIFAIVLGITGEAHKSSTMNACRAIGRMARSGQDVRIVGGVSSAEGLLEQFCDKQTVSTDKGYRTVLTPTPGQRVLLHESEFTSTLKKSRRAATANIVEALRDLFDSIDKKTPTRQASIEIKEPFFSVITATTPEGIEKTLQEEDVDEGTLPRYATFICTPRPPVSYAYPFDNEELQRLSDDLDMVRQYAQSFQGGYMPMSHGALEMWDSYYIALKDYKRKIGGQHGNMLERVPTHIMRWALIYAVQAQHQEILVGDMESALLVGNYLAWTSGQIVRQFAKHPIAKEEEKILRYLFEKYPVWVEFRDVVSRVKGKLKGKDLHDALDGMVRRGLIEESKKDTNRDTSATIFRYIKPDEA